MRTSNGNTTVSQAEWADPTQPAASNRTIMWARGRRQITPWAYPHLRALAAIRFVIGIFLVGMGGLMLSRGYGWAALPLAGAALHFAIAYRDITAARSVAVRT
jgi:hypothetical protein